MDFMIWLCCALIIAGAAVEYFTRKLIAVWVIPASVTAIALCLSEVELVFQLVALVGITLLGIALSYLFIIPRCTDEITVDNIIGHTCTVSERVDNYAGCGQVKVRGQFWSARAVSDDAVYEVGERLSVVAIEGVKLICKKK